MDRQPPRAFSTREALHFAWAKTCENVRPFVVIGLIGAFLGLLHQALTGPSGAYGGAQVLAVVVKVLQAAVTMTYVRVALQLADGRTPEWGQPQSLLADFFSYLLTTVLLTFILLAGLLLLVIPGVFWALKFGYAPFLVLEGKHDPLAALRESARITRGAKKQLFGLGLVLVGINVLGALAFGVGLLVTLPTGFIAAAYVMRRLQAHAQDETPVAPEDRSPPYISGSLQPRL